MFPYDTPSSDNSNEHIQYPNNHCNYPTQHVNHHIQSTPNRRVKDNSNKFPFYPTHALHGQSGYIYVTDQQLRMASPHQIPPHQQYENNVRSGLGGIWKQKDNGDMFWSNLSSYDIRQKDKGYVYNLIYQL